MAIEETQKNWTVQLLCRSCGEEALLPMLDLGTTPPANAFLERKDLDASESLFPLRVVVCQNCFLVQLQDTLDPKALFERDYYYFTGASAPLAKHFLTLGKRLAEEFSLTKDDLVVEMGSNDGILLSAIAPYARVLGVDPALNVAEEAKKRGVPTMQAFFGEESAKAILEAEGPARLIIGNNVFAHIPDIHDVVRGISLLLRPDGQFIAEMHWVGNLMGDGGFDQIYHEHIYYYSLHALKHLIEKEHGLTISKVERIPIHGESLRIFVTKDGEVDSSVTKLLEEEKALGLDVEDTYLEFASRVNNTKQKLVETLNDLKRDGKKIVGYGAPAKGNTLLNFCLIGPELLDYIVDTTPNKQGTYTPGMRIPVVSPDILRQEIPDYILLLSWNYADAILEKEKELREKGVKFIIPVPNVRIV
jgi:SAM-dependent methyltransferase